MIGHVNKGKDYDRWIVLIFNMIQTNSPNCYKKYIESIDENMDFDIGGLHKETTNNKT